VHRSSHTRWGLGRDYRNLVLPLRSALQRVWFEPRISWHKWVRYVLKYCMIMFKPFVKPILKMYIDSLKICCSPSALQKSFLCGCGWMDVWVSVWGLSTKTRYGYWYSSFLIPPVILFCRFEEIAFSFNGGKDSTVIFHILLFSSFFVCCTDN
jgi:hypothetical protein